MLDEIIGVYAIIDDLLKAIGHKEDCRERRTHKKGFPRLKKLTPKPSGQAAPTEIPGGGFPPL